METALTEFLANEKAIDVMKEVRRVKMELDALKEEEKKIRETLEGLMEFYGITGFDNDILKVTYKQATSRESLDSKALRAECPEIYEKYVKVSPVKASVTIKVK